MTQSRKDTDKAEKPETGGKSKKRVQAGETAQKKGGKSRRKSSARSGEKASTSSHSQNESPAPDEGYRVLARKYRPTSFAALIGQDAMVRTLENAFASGRIAQAYMLTGVRGVGKTTTARILARALNYETDTVNEPTLHMPEMGRHCAAILESRHVDVLEMDAASHTGIDDIREIIESARYLPVSARYKVYIIDEVHMLSKQAFNGLLKTLEEPPPHVKFIFATTEVHKVPVTILSRCQRFDLKRVSAERLMSHFAQIAEKEGVTISEAALALIARAAEGSVRDGLSLLDQAIAHGGGQVSAEDVQNMLGLSDRSRIFALLESLLGGKAAEALDRFQALYEDGADPQRVLTELAALVHGISRTKATGEPGDTALGEAERARMKDMAEKLSIPVLARSWQMLLKGLTETAQAPDPKAAAEMILIRLAYVADLPPPAEIARLLTETAANPSSLSTAPTTGTPPGQAPQAPPPGGQAVGNGGTAMVAPEAHATPSAAAPLPKDFPELVALVGEKRELLLKLALESQVRLVRYEPGRIELHLLADAPAGLANDLARKLKQWTGRTWMVTLSQEEGAPPLAEQAEKARAQEIATLRKHPLVKAVFDLFPDAEITEIRESGDQDPD